MTLAERIRWIVDNRTGGNGRELARKAEALTAALVAPRAAFNDAILEHGDIAFQQLAFDFMTTQTCTALRLGEVTGTPVAVLRPGLVRVRGEPWGWPETERGVRALALAEHLPIRRIQLTDGRRRIALVA